VTTSIPTVLVALAALAEVTLPDSWQIINGPASSVTTLGPQVIVVGETVEGNRDLDGMTYDSLGEQYNVQVDFSVDLPGTAQTAADTIAFEGFAAFDSALRANDTLGIDGVLQAVLLGEFLVTRQASQTGRYTHIRSFVAVHAHQT
jgi:hypothetical protein